MSLPDYLGVRAREQDPGDALADYLKKEAAMYEQLGRSHPKLSRGRVWCIACGRSESVKAASALRSGWPRCCGATMTIDSPEERRALTGAT